LELRDAVQISKETDAVFRRTAPGQDVDTTAFQRMDGRDIRSNTESRYRWRCSVVKKFAMLVHFLTD
jgi:hypothetical protein